MDLQFIESIMIKSALTDMNYLSLIATTLDRDFFDNPAAKEIYEFVAQNFISYGTIPQRGMIVNSVEENVRDEVISYLDSLEEVDFDTAAQFDFLIDNTEMWLKDKAVKHGILQSVDLIDRGSPEDYSQVRGYIEDALSRSIKVNLGLDYFNRLGDRLRRIAQSTDIRIPSYFPMFDEYVNGGFPAYSLSVFVAQIHGFKSNAMANMAARQVLAGHNVFLLTLEMSEDAFAQRFDSIFSGLDINALYRSNDNIRNLAETLGPLKQSEGRGELYIKDFPTGAASVDDFRIFIREMLIRGIKPSIIYVDYINLMKAAMKAGDGLYQTVKKVAEELRALGFEFSIPVISVSQLNREGSFVEFDELNFNYIAESIGVPATADFMCIFGTDEDKLVYENELHYKIVKNRLGGRVGEIDKFYYDARSLKMYDSSEESVWHDDARVSRDDRNPYEPPPQERQRTRRR